MRVSEITRALEGMDLSPTQLRSLVTALSNAADKSTDPMVKGFKIALEDVASDVDHEIWEEAEAVKLRSGAEMKDDMAELAGEY